MTVVLPLNDQEVAAEALSLRERNRDRARAAIVDSALELFAARGFDEVSVADVAGARRGVAGDGGALLPGQGADPVLGPGDQRGPAACRSARPAPVGVADAGPRRCLARATAASSGGPAAAAAQPAGDRPVGGAAGPSGRRIGGVARRDRGCAGRARRHRRARCRAHWRPRSWPCSTTPQPAGRRVAAAATSATRCARRSRPSNELADGCDGPAADKEHG